MTFVVLFNGQGEQRAEHVARLRATLSADLDGPLRAALRDAGTTLEGIENEQLPANRVAQPLICAYQLALWRALAPQLPRPDLVAGYSLGELTAFAAAGAFSPPATVSLAAERARLMNASTPVPSGLAAVLGLVEPTVSALCAAHGAEIAIRNGPKHFIVGGPLTALACVVADAVTAGASKAQVMCVPTPSHTSVLRPAAQQFDAAMRAVLEARLDIPALSGVRARAIRAIREVTDALEIQTYRTLDWYGCMQAILEFRPDAVLEIGPGTGLTRMLVELEPRLNARSVDEFRSVEGAIAWVAARTSR